MAEANTLQNRRTFSEPSFTHSPDFHADGKRTTLVYDKEVPPFAEAELERLYGSIYSTVGMFRYDGSLATASTYAAWENGKLVCLLLFRRERSTVTVLNGSIKIEWQEIERFAQTIFSKDRFASVIRFHTIQTDVRNPAYPFQKHHAGEDIVATLPSSPQEYLASLGKNMRETVKRHHNRLKRTFPSFRFQAYVNGEADDRHIWELCQLQRARMQSTNRVSRITDEEIVRIIDLVKTCGLVTVATISDRICGGMICWRAGDNFFLRVIAHDPQYDDAKLGTLCCYLSICECIERGGKAFYFSGGRVLYKYRFLGIEQNFDRVVLYRSRLHMLLSCVAVLRNAISGNIREAKLWLLDAETRDDAPSRIALKLQNAWRTAKVTQGTLKKIAAFSAALKPPRTGNSNVVASTFESHDIVAEITARRHAQTKKSAAAGETDFQAA